MQLRGAFSSRVAAQWGRISGDDDDDDPALSSPLSLPPLHPPFSNLGRPSIPTAMLGKRPRSVIGKLSELLVSGSAGLLESAVAAAAAASPRSPRSPLDFKIQSPRGPRSYDLGGVGLGIVAALEKPGDAKILLLTKNCAGGPGSARPGPNGGGSSTAGACAGVDDDMEDYTYVTFHGPNQSFTMVYYGEGKCDGVGRGGCGGSGGFGGSMRRVGSVGEGGGEGPVFQALGFLSSCQLCGKKLHGEDIYMYRYHKFLLFFFDSQYPLAVLLFFVHRGRYGQSWLESCSGCETSLRYLNSERKFSLRTKTNDQRLDLQNRSNE